MSSTDDKSAAPAAPDPLDAALNALDGANMDGFEFTINPDGSVTFVDFPPELLDIAYALNPDDPLVCERRAVRDDSGSGGADS